MCTDLMYIPDHRATSQSSLTNGEMSLVIPVVVVVGVVLVVVAVVIVICCKRPKRSRALRFVVRYIFYM